MEADTSLSIKGDGVAISPDTNSHGLVVWASQSATTPVWEVIDIPLAPSQMLTVAAWLVDMALDTPQVFREYTKAIEQAHTQLENLIETVLYADAFWEIPEVEDHHLKLLNACKAADVACHELQDFLRDMRHEHPQLATRQKGLQEQCSTR